MEFSKMIEQALQIAKERELSSTASAGDVAAALLTDSGAIYLGICIDTSCGMGFCAEHAAAAAMITAGESTVVKMVAVNGNGEILPPCGRCREFISQLSDRNLDTQVMVNQGKIVRLRDLLPYDWRDVYTSNGNGDEEVN